MTRKNAAIASLLGGLVGTPAGVYLWQGPGLALVTLGVLLLLVSLLTGWNA